MHYSVCLPAVLGGRNQETALNIVREAGFSHYEIWSWWDRDLDELLRLQQENDLSIAALCTRMIPLNIPEKREEYLKGLYETAQVCRKLGCSTVISQVGAELEGVSREAQHKSIVEGLRACIPLLREYNLTLTFEPLNTRVDHKGYYLWSSEEAFQIADEVNSPHVKILYDLYHQGVMGDLDLDRIVENIDRIGHFHMAGVPGRHEPLIDSQVPYEEILRAIRKTGYSGSVGLEYIPVQDAVSGLAELNRQLNNL